MDYLSLFFLLLIGHAVADYPLQSDHMAKYKSWRTPSNPPSGQKPNVIWPYVLSAHAFTHAGAVVIITGSVFLGFLEFVCHWLIDLAKCSNITNIHVDQWLHIGCKALWVFIIWQQGVSL